MDDRFYKLKRAVIALVIVFAVFFLYNYFSKTPDIPVNKNSPIEEKAARSKSIEPEDVKNVGPIGIGQLEMARFSTLNPRTKKLEREFGFEKLLYEQGNQWEIERPYMNIYRPDLTCFLTAEKGFVVLESNVNPPTPKDATLIGNVKAHIVPTEGSDIKEAFVYLEDLSFFSENSRFVTEGPIDFISDNNEVVVKGKGLDLIYDQANRRLAMLRIKEINEMVFRSYEDYSLTKNKNPKKNIKSRPEKTETKKDFPYICLFGNNVTIDTGQEIVAADQLSISNIIWKSTPTDNEQTKGISGQDSISPDQKQKDAGIVSVPENTDDMTEVVIDCKEGFIVVPQQPDAIAQAKEIFAGQKPAKWDLNEKARQLEGRIFFIAKEVDYDVTQSQAVADGRSLLQFYVKDVIGADTEGMAVPVTVSSDKKVRFSGQDNRIIFEQNCVCKMVRFEQLMLQEYLLKGDKLIVTLADQTDEYENSSSIESILTLGGTGNPARLSSVKKVGNDMITGVELKCPKFEYNAIDNMFAAYGPGVIKVNNSKIPQPGPDVGKFSLERPCYAVVKDFDELSYYLDREKIIAFSEKGRLLIDYFPIIENENQKVSLTAGRIEADLVETANGNYRLWTLNASRGISFEDENKFFEGSEISYNDQKSIIRAKGSDDMPAIFNGALFDGIEWDLKTDEIKNVHIKGPAYIQTIN